MEEFPMEVDYQGTKLNFSIWKRDLWDYCTSLLSNRRLILDFHWYAEKRYRHDGKKWVRFIDEPYTADRWWDIQVPSIVCMVSFERSPLCNSPTFLEMLSLCF